VPAGHHRIEIGPRFGQRLEIHGLFSTPADGATWFQPPLSERRFTAPKGFGIATRIVSTPPVVMPMTHNTYLELLGEALFVGIVLLFAFRGAGAW